MFLFPVIFISFLFSFKIAFLFVPLPWVLVSFFFLSQELLLLCETEWAAVICFGSRRWTGA